MCNHTTNSVYPIYNTTIYPLITMFSRVIIVNNILNILMHCDVIFYHLYNFFRHKNPYLLYYRATMVHFQNIVPHYHCSRKKFLGIFFFKDSWLLFKLDNMPMYFDVPMYFNYYYIISNIIKYNVRRTRINFILRFGYHTLLNNYLTFCRPIHTTIAHRQSYHYNSSYVDSHTGQSR